MVRVKSPYRQERMIRLPVTIVWYLPVVMSSKVLMASSRTGRWGHTAMNSLSMYLLTIFEKNEFFLVKRKKERLN